MLSRCLRYGLVACALVLTLPRAAGARAGNTSIGVISAPDRHTGQVAAQIAGRSPSAAVRWASRQKSIHRARLMADGRTVSLAFKDGGRLYLLPKTMGAKRTLASGGAALTQLQLRPRADAQPKAAILEPFAWQLNEGDDLGQNEADLLTKAGFRVDIFRNKQVTVQLLLQLAQYSLVFMETHADAGNTAGGDAYIATDETNTAPYIKMFGPNAFGLYHPNQPHPLVQVMVDGDRSGNLYNAIDTYFVSQYLGSFPDSSAILLDGCTVLQAPEFLNALMDKNLSTVVSWDQEVAANTARAGLDYVLSGMAGGQSVQQAIQAAQASGAGTATTANGPSHLSFFGSGDLTIEDVLAQSTPTITPTPSGTLTPTPTLTSTPAVTPLTVDLKKSVKDGQKQTIGVTSDPHTPIQVQVTYPNHDRVTHTMTTNATGTAKWSYKQPSSTTTHSRFTATVKVTAAGAAPRSKTVKYTIHFGSIDASVEPRTTSGGKTIKIYVHARTGTRVQVYVLAPAGKERIFEGTTGRNGFATFKYRVPTGLIHGSSRTIKLLARFAANTRVSTATSFTIE